MSKTQRSRRNNSSKLLRIIEINKLLKDSKVVVSANQEVVAYWKSEACCLKKKHAINSNSVFMYNFYKNKNQIKNKNILHD